MVDGPSQRFIQQRLRRFLVPFPPLDLHRTQPSLGCASFLDAQVRGMINYHTGDRAMSSVKVAITLEEDTLRQVDSLVARRVFPNRSRAIQTALHEKIERVEGNRLAAECAKLDSKFEQSLAEEGLGVDAASWPEF
jgi:Arc/MetJ-type ribon-helix-helix transcriptional regulator